MQKHSASVKYRGKNQNVLFGSDEHAHTHTHTHTRIRGWQTQTAHFLSLVWWFSSLSPPLLKSFYLWNPSRPPSCFDVIITVGQSGPAVLQTHSQTQPHTLIYVKYSSEKCSFHLFSLCANSLILLYIQLHTVDSLLCNKQTDSLPAALLTLAIVWFQQLT